MNPMNLLIQANKAFRNHDYKTAVELYQQYAQQSPEHQQRIVVNLKLAEARLNVYKKHAEQYSKTAHTAKDKIIVYTVNIGGYESVKEPLAIDPTVEYILFTDNKDLKSKHWKIIQLTDKLDDPRRTSRLPKILAHKYLPEHDISVYIDSSLEIKTQDVHQMVAECMAGEDIAHYKHYKRDCVYDEINFVMNSTDRVVANKELCKQALKKYEAISYPKKNGLFENAFIFRRNTKKIQHLNELWWNEYQAGTERDQFVFMYALNQTGIKPNAIKEGKEFRENPFVNFFSHKYKPSQSKIKPTKLLSGMQRVISRNIKDKNTSQSGVTVITPTGDRFAAFNRCIQWVLTQTVMPSQWIIVDDGTIPLTDAMQLPKWATYVRRERKPTDPPHTLSSNLLSAIDHIENDKILIMEDDDWYAPNYIEFMLPYFDQADMIATNRITYYHLLGRVWKQGKPAKHSALAQTGFTQKAIPQLKRVCEMDNWEIREKGLVDRYWWHSFEGTQLLIQEPPLLHAGFKGLFGRKGLAEGHEHTSWGYKKDDDYTFLKSIIGDDIVFYKFWADGQNKPFAIYTAISGGYDSLKEPLKDSPLFDFYVFSDVELQSEKWRFIPLDEEERNKNITAKKPKILPHLYFPHYQYSIFIDANIFILEDIQEYLIKMIESNVPIAQFSHPERTSLYDEAKICIEKSKCKPEIIENQIARYKKEGFKDQVGLRECNFIVREHAHPNVTKANGIWWNEVCENSERDQLAYPYSLWKAFISPFLLANKGESVRCMPHFYYVRHGGDVIFENYQDKILRHKEKWSVNNGK